MDRSTEDVVCSLQAQLHVQGLVLRALVATHPDPAALLAAWQRVLADTGTGPAAIHARHSAYLGERCQAHAEDWTAELVELTFPRLNADGMATSDGSVVSTPHRQA